MKKLLLIGIISTADDYDIIRLDSAELIRRRF